MARDREERRNPRRGDDDRGSRSSRDRDKGKDDDRRSTSSRSSRDDDRGRDRDRDDDRSRDKGRDDDRGSKRSGSGFKYRERDEDSLRRRQQQSGGSFDAIILPDFPYFKPTVGENEVRILPPTWEDTEKWGTHYGIDLWVHRNIGPDSGSYLCRAKLLGEECALCDARRELEASNAEMDDINMIRPQKSVAVWMIDRDDEQTGPKVWTMGYTLDKNIANLSKDRKGGGILLIDHPEEGYDVYFTRDGEGKRTRYISVQVARDGSPITDNAKLQDKWLDYITQHPITDTLQFFDNDYLAKAWGGTGERRDRDMEKDDDRPKSRGRGRDDDDKKDDRDDDRSSRGRGRDDDDDRDKDKDDDPPKSRGRGRDDDDDKDDRGSSSRRGKGAELDDDIPSDDRKRGAGRDEESPRRRDDRDDDKEGSRRGRGDDDDDDKKGDEPESAAAKARRRMDERRKAR